MTAGWFPRPPSLPAVDTTRLVVEASAGTGKTFFLEHRVADLVLAGATIDQILLVTFTEKATAELRARIRALLARLASAGARPADATGPGWDIDDAGRTALRAALDGFDKAAIHTIHGFCQRILLEDAFAGRRLLEQTQIADEIAFDDAFLSALREVFAVEPDAVALLRHALAVGRSVDELRALLLKVYRSGAPITPPFDRAAVVEKATFARATIELFAGRERHGHAAVQLLADGRITHAGTSTAFKKRVDALQKALIELDVQDPLAVLSMVAGHREQLEYLREFRERDQARSIAAALEPFVELADVTPSLDAAIAHAFMPEILRRLAARKQRRGQFDYQDMLALVWAILDGERGADLAARLRRRHPWAMIDEFQDTDPVQWKIFERVWLHADARGLAIVGDPKQAIYSFRGADVATYLMARDQMLAAGALRLDLADNYRSSTRVITAINGLLEGRGDDGFFTGAIGYDVPVRAAAGIECVRAAADDDDLADDGGPAVRVLTVADDRKADALRALLHARIGAEIEDLLHGAGQLAVVPRPGRAPEPLRARDIFVLTRSNGEALAVAEVLRGRGLPCALYRADYLFETAEAKAVCDVLAAVAAPRDRSKRLTAWTTPFFGVPLDRLAALGDLPDTHPLVAPLHEWRALAMRRDYGALFARILDDSRVAERALVAGHGARMLANLHHVFELLAAEVARTRPELHDLVTTLRGWIERGTTDRPDEADVQRIEEDGDAIQIMTAHRAKGLEAAVVFVVGGDGGRAGIKDKVKLYVDDAGQRVAYVGDGASAQTRIQQFAREENQRLCYVAMTRAKVRLYLWLGNKPVAEDAAYAPIDRALRRQRERAAELGLAFVPVVDAPAPPAADVDQLLSIDALTAPWPDPAPPAPLPPGRAGFAVTSFTALARSGVLDDVREVRTDAEAPVVATPPDELPPGAATGVFLHELLELLDFAAADTDRGAWLARPDVANTFAAVARRHGVTDRAHLAHAQRMVHTTLTTPITTGGLSLPPLCHATRVAREVEFAFPLPRRSGFVTGFIDLLVAWDHRVWIVDYKSNVLPELGLTAAEATVAHDYELQARLYALAAHRMLGAHGALGGVLFWFLRPQLIVPRTYTASALDAWHADLGRAETP